MAKSVIVPLYVYPTVGAWDPVFDMLVHELVQCWEVLFF